MKNKIFSLLLVVLFVFGISLLVKNQEGYLYVEDRPKSQLTNITKDVTFNAVNSVMGDQIFCRDRIISVFLNFFDMFSRGEKVICYNREQIKIKGIYYDNSYTRLEDGVLETCANKAFNINEISNKYPDIKTYVYNPVRYLYEPILDTLWIPNNYEEFENTFLFYLGDKVKYKKISYLDTEIGDYFYKTDHHYNVYGADKSYREIVNMINEDFDIGEAKKLIKVNELSNTFRGSYSDVCENLDDIYDDLCAGDYGIDSKDYDYYINGKLDSIFNERNSINDSIFSNTRTYDAYFNSNIGETVFDYNDSSKKNILIISDSYVGPIKEVLSSHFNKSIIICGDRGLDNLLLDKTIKENNIDIILVLLFQQNLYYNGYYFIPIN